MTRYEVDSFRRLAPGRGDSAPLTLQRARQGGTIFAFAMTHPGRVELGRLCDPLGYVIIATYYWCNMWYAVPMSNQHPAPYRRLTHVPTGAAYPVRMPLSHAVRLAVRSAVRLLTLIALATLIVVACVAFQAHNFVVGYTATLPLLLTGALILADAIKGGE